MVVVAKERGGRGEGGGRKEWGVGGGYVYFFTISKLCGRRYNNRQAKKRL